ncbi:helix-turn-helix domain-containing protein [Haloarchaeobius sp. HME9146]|uniref:helix-turn-helix domain-containing protein n=1 Tax=Haloarchaeobius sp. HME9146 TaxID=2978732 RepID=UPI0021BE27A4|nr:bacterio-opsin activator domain-containing protein [Haloarchaeobius sp. HME9146]MCT9095541.1 helix-turn-helix domain-containing protein [Haloarchaeobius sp. HME9146]
MAQASTGDNDETVELEFTVRDQDCFFVVLSARADCRMELEHLAHRSDGTLLEFITVEGATPDEVRDVVADLPAVKEAECILDSGDGCLFQFVLAGPCVAATLGDVQAYTREVWAEGGVGHVVADVPAHVSVRTVVETFEQRHSDVTLRSRHDRRHRLPVQSENGTRALFAQRLTEKQQEVLRVAYDRGYFDWPRGASAEECADELGISQPTFSQHIRAAQANMFATLFEEDEAALGR